MGVEPCPKCGTLEAVYRNSGQRHKCKMAINYSNNGFSPLVKTETIHGLEYHEFEKLVHEHIDESGKYSFTAGEETGNDTAQTFMVDDPYPGELEQLEGEGPYHQYQAGILLTKLAAEGIIPKGKYVIEVSW